MQFDNDGRHERMRDFHNRCVSSSPAEQGDRILEASELFPNDWRRDNPHQRAAALEAMLSADAFESAALSLLPPDLPLIVSRAADGDAFATVAIAGHGELTFEARTVALAVLAAHSAALLAGQTSTRPQDLRR